MIVVLTFTLALLATVCSDVRSDALAKHNAYRAKHGAPAMRWHSGAAAHAQKHCDYLARTGRFSHSNSNYGG